MNCWTVKWFLEFCPSIAWAIDGVIYGSWSNGDELGGTAWIRCCDARYADSKAGILANARAIAMNESFIASARGATSYFSIQMSKLGS